MILKKIWFIVVVIIFLCLPKIVIAQELSFSWTHDNPDSVAGYNFYIKEYPNGDFKKIWTGTESNYTFTAVTGIKYGFTISTFNKFAESLKSVELIYTAEGEIGDAITIPSRPKIIIMKF